MSDIVRSAVTRSRPRPAEGIRLKVRFPRTIARIMAFAVIAANYISFRYTGEDSGYRNHGPEPARKQAVSPNYQLCIMASLPQATPIRSPHCLQAVCIAFGRCLLGQAELGEGGSCLPDPAKNGGTAPPLGPRYARARPRTSRPSGGCISGGGRSSARYAHERGRRGSCRIAAARETCQRCCRHAGDLDPRLRRTRGSGDTGANAEGGGNNERKPAKGLSGPVLELRQAGSLCRWLADDLPWV